VSPLIIGFVLVSLMVFSPQFVFAQEGILTLPPVILPDNFFYGLKLAIETIQENFTFQDDLRAELLLKHAEERDREAQELERLMKTIPLERLKQIQADKIMKAEQIIRRIESIRNMELQRQQVLEDREEIAQATTEAERIMIQLRQEERLRQATAQIIEPTITGGLIEGEQFRFSDRPVTVLPVTDITESDDTDTIIDKLKIRLANAFNTSEITEIRARFAELRAEQDPDRKEFLADSLDEQVNNPLVSITCFGRVNTLSLSLASEPIEELQEQCPILRTFTTNQLRDVANGFP